MRRIILNLLAYLVLILVSATTYAAADMSGLSFSAIKTAQSSGTSEAMVVDGGRWW